MPILVIVESPGKIKKINSILGKDYIVKASVGHVRDLDHKNLGIDLENNFKPTYVISKDKKKVVSDLRNCVKSCSEVNWALFGVSMATYNVLFSSSLSCISFATGKVLSKALKEKVVI